MPGRARQAKVIQLAERRRSSRGMAARRLQRPSIALPVFESPSLSATLSAALIVSLIVHTLLFSLAFKLPASRLRKAPSTTLEVVLVNRKSAKPPVQPDVLAQANIDGGGNTDEKRRAKTPLPIAPKQNNRHDDANRSRKVRDLEREAEQLMTKLQAENKAPTPAPQIPPVERREEPSPSDLVERSLQMARLEAQIARNVEVYQQRPKRQFIGSRAKEFRFATYVDQWRQKIERVGNLNYPEDARNKKIYGQLQLTVAIKSDGTLERVDISRSSGYPVLDQAAKRIVHLASPFARFSDDIRTDTDILEITRTWTFTREDQISAE